ncbi:hypothetical protein EMIHUDRAFT_243627 [Emiliania huxleyi CCMP1516]|uniref:CCHC-type domain-containing protein n=2 Tax=Emiliania huxleyi TaxID=2903 RepID=A0A0D3J551_EMIH1|nr:hypothetical protein EMIHUDRAFT_243627 [Emiliania huxleyi CCMP1516]EOD18636.1 hypothetical protein EMIHUDRAFT_243627 [Emiliania huxleyi CCMP1516]|eukprot:XP_005771065.1 hypothetical protein EMIHUDRAFT_243627 [Emiliania huxleyi CCMP1516]
MTQIRDSVSNWGLESNWLAKVDSLDPKPSPSELYDNFVYSVEADTMGFYTSSISSVEASLGPPTDDCKPNVDALAAHMQRYLTRQSALHAPSTRVLFSAPERRGDKPRDRPGKARDPPFAKNRGAPPNRENRPKPSAGGAKGQRRDDRKGGRKPGGKEPADKAALRCHRCGASGHTRSECPKPKQSCPFIMPNGRKCGQDHHISTCWYKDPSKCPNPRIRERIQEKLKRASTLLSTDKQSKIPKQSRTHALQKDPLNTPTSNPYIAPNWTPQPAAYTPGLG